MPASGAELVVSWKNVRLTRDDVALFRDGQWLNDECVTFFLEHLKLTRGTEEARVLLVGAETAFWFLMEDDLEDLADAAEGLELSQRDLVVCPVNDNADPTRASGGSHWSLLVGRKAASTSAPMVFEYYDSMSTANLGAAQRLAAKIAALRGGGAAGGAKAARREAAEVRVMETAKQANSYDCGVYVLLFAQAVVEAFLAGDASPAVEAERDGVDLKNANVYMQGDKKTVLQALKKDPGGVGQHPGRPRSSMQYATTQLRSDREFVKQAVKLNGLALEFAEGILKLDREIYTLAVKQNGLALEFCQPLVLKDREIVTMAVETTGTALQFADKSLRDDPEIVLKAVQQDWPAMQFASVRLRGDRDCMIKAVQCDWLVLEFAEEHLLSDKELMSQAVKLNWRALQYGREAIRDDHDVFELAVSKNWLSLEYASDKIRDDREVISKALESDYRALVFASKRLKADRDLVMQAVEKSGLALSHADPKYQADREIVMTAVQDNGLALSHTSKELQGDREIVLEAVKTYGAALQYAASPFRADKEVCLEACQAEICGGHKAVDYVAKPLQDDPDIKQAVQEWVDPEAEAAAQRRSKLSAFSPFASETPEKKEEVTGVHV